ncbi:MAG: FeoB-associated Cys-rich membrane protein [Clostridia bacterium]|nr:FeoB-associated Cys-rich membrane protein [Clostridia bacterium]
MTWLTANGGTILVSALILLAAGLILRSLLRAKKKGGKPSCGCGCENCAMRGQCHKT